MKLQPKCSALHRNHLAGELCSLCSLMPALYMWNWSRLWYFVLALVVIFFLVLPPHRSEGRRLTSREILFNKVAPHTVYALVPARSPHLGNLADSIGRGVNWKIGHEMPMRRSAPAERENSFRSTQISARINIDGFVSIQGATRVARDKTNAHSAQRCSSVMP